MPGSDAFKGDIAAIMQRNMEQHAEEEQKKDNSAPTSIDDKKSAKRESSGWKKKKAQGEELPADDGPGTYQKAHGARPKTGEENLHNKAIAEAAAKKFNKDKKKIQRAVRKIDPDTPKQEGCACVIM
jgi:hypothetical protein